MITSEATEPPKKQRNYHRTISFSDDEYAEIQAVAKQLKLYPRQAIMLKIRAK